MAWRILGLVFLVLATFGTGVLYEDADIRPYPEASEIAADPVAHDGDRILLFGEVESTNERDGTVTVLLEDNRTVGVGIGGVTEEIVHQQAVTISTPDPSTVTNLEPGAQVQAYGTLEEGSSALVAEEFVVDVGGSDDLRYVLGSSILGAILTAGYFLVHWRIDWRRLRFESRGEERG